MLKPVLLMPCCDKINQSAAEILFGVTHDEWKVDPEKGKNGCPVCKQEVIGYTIDHWAREISETCRSFSEDQIKSLILKVETNLTEKSLADQKKDEKTLPYPGKSARFLYDCGSWEKKIIGKNVKLCRDLDFKSCSKDSFIKEFSIYGYINGYVYIYVNVSEDHTEAAKIYFKQFDMNPHELFNDRFVAKTPAQLKLIFNVLAENNEIPEKYFGTIKAIVEKGTCD